MKDLDITPTKQGFLHMKDMFKDSVKRHRQDQELLDNMLSVGYKFEFSNEKEDQLITEALELLYAHKSQSIRELQEAIKEIEEKVG